MNATLETAAARTARAPHSRGWPGQFRTAAVALATALALSACGGGDDDGGHFDVGVTVDGRYVSQTLVAPGDSISFAIYAGQSVVLDAGEPVIWTLYVDGSAVPRGAQVYYAGADIRATTLSDSAVAVDTHADVALPAAIPITLIATSTYDSAEVGVDILITD